MMITLLITTRGRLAKLQRLFDSLAQQSYQHFSVLLGDQNPSGYLDNILEQYRPCFEIRHHLIAPQSLSQARNVLLPLVEGDIIAFTDDDCYYAKDTLRLVVETFTASPAAVLIARHDAPHANLTAPSKLENMFTVLRDAPSWALFFRREVLHAVGVFDENMGIGSLGLYQSGEETDYLIRSLACKYSIMRAPAIVVLHDKPNITSADISQKTYAYALGRMYLLRKHNFPLWFKLANVIYPIWRAFVEGPSAWAYRWSMFKGRLKGLWGGGSCSRSD